MFDWINILSPIICSLVSGLLAYFAACRSSKKELDALRMEWEHQNIVQDDQEFSEMCRLVYALADNHFSTNTNTIAAVAVVRSKATGAYAKALDELLAAVSSTQRVKIYPAIKRVISERSLVINSDKK